MSHNTWAHRFVGLAVRPLAKTSVTPNQITAVRLATGLAAAAALAAGFLHLGAGLWLLSMLCDRADGMLARLTGKSTPWGHKFDLVSDFLATGLLFIGLGAGMRHGSLGDWAPAMGVAAGLSVCLIFGLVQIIDKMLPSDSAAVPSAAGFDADDTLFIVAPVIWLGGAEEFLIVSAIGAPIALVVTMLALWRIARRSRDL
ncbi:MAG: CDP-alcohol phosphatidyltransferase family protein [Alphaproteobacteria bacterium]|jgi:phosphatidylglycerophosphate synthase|nr:CDP-alcohol phosphatidyltransferase family protein [Alphaproteobacteria bacterium]